MIKTCYAVGICLRNSLAVSCEDITRDKDVIYRCYSFHLIEVDVDTTAYEQGHIPGAVGFNWQKELQDQVGARTGE
jgi:3-mercaptopyruvate sulfurtransferase SseA